MSKWMAIGLILAVAEGAASCSRKESTEAVQEPVKPSESIAGEVADAKAGAGSAAAVESVVAEGADLEKVEERTGAFQDMLDLMHSSAGSEGFNAHRVEIDSFVQGKTDRVLLDFAKDMAEKSPFATMQVLAWLIKNTQDTQILFDACSWFIVQLPEFGSKEDRPFAIDTLNRLNQMYIDPENSASLSAEDRDVLVAVEKNYLVLLGLDSQAWQQIADDIRKSARTDFDLSCADSFESAAIIRRGQVSEALRLRKLHQSIIDRGVWGKRVTPEASQYWLSMTDAELVEKFKMGAEKTSLGRKQRLEEWDYVSNMPDDERIRMSNESRTKANKE